LLKDIRVYAIASRFLLEGLMSLALDKFQNSLSNGWQSDLFADCVEEVYDHTCYNAVRPVVVEAATTHVHDLITRDTFIDLLYRGGDFVHDFVKRLHKSKVYGSSSS